MLVLYIYLLGMLISIVILFFIAYYEYIKITNKQQFKEFFNTILNPVWILVPVLWPLISVLLILDFFGDNDIKNKIIEWMADRQFGNE